jgi:hypothetical protein
VDFFCFSFVGDIHQPLHASRSSDKGGNDFHVHVDFPVGQSHVSLPSETYIQHKAWNLHSVWDTAIIEHAIDLTYSSSREAFENHLEDISHSVKYNNDVIRWLQCPDGRSKDCTIQWGEESFQASSS